MLATFKGEIGDHETNADDFFLCVGYIGLQVVQLHTLALWCLLKKQVRPLEKAMLMKLFSSSLMVRVESSFFLFQCRKLTGGVMLCCGSIRNVYSINNGKYIGIS